MADAADGPLSDAPQGGGVKFAPERQSGEKRMNSAGCFFMNLEAVTDTRSKAVCADLYLKGMSTFRQGRETAGNRE